MAERRHNLPVQPTPLIGRERAVRAVCDLLMRDEVRLVTLTGPGGTGKTRVGIEVAAELLDVYADSVVFVGLAPIADPALVIPTIAQAVGVRDAGNRPILETLHAYLREKRLLLLLDNFEQILPAAPSIAELLAACPGMKALVTSRAPLHLRGEHEYPVSPLPLPSHMEPGQRATEVRPDFALTDENAPVVAEICRRMDGLPLAIELAAARIKVLPPQALLARLERRLPLLTGGPRDAPECQRTLRDTIAWSGDLLDGAEQTLFRRLAVFVGGCTIEAAEAVCNADGDLGVDILDGITSLVDNSLLQQTDGPLGEPRFTMLETVREYALEQLQEAGEESEARRRHLAWFVEVAECSNAGLRSPESLIRLDRLDADQDNVRAALTWSLTDPIPSSARAGLRLVTAYFSFWHDRNHPLDSRRWIERMLAADLRADWNDDSAEMSVPEGRFGAFAGHPRVAAFCQLGILGHHGGNLEHALSTAREGLALARRLEDRLGEAHMLVTIGGLDRASGRYDRAVPVL